MVDVGGGESAEPVLPRGAFYFVPGYERDSLVRALAGPACAVVADLEDMTPAEEKGRARDVVKGAFSEADRRLRPWRVVRINSPSSPYFADDLNTLRETPLLFRRPMPMHVAEPLNSQAARS